MELTNHSFKLIKHMPLRLSQVLRLKLNTSIIVQDKHTMSREKATRHPGNIFQSQM